MGYRIEYDKGSGKYELKEGHPTVFVLLLGAVSLFLLFAVSFWPEETAALRSALIPGEDTVTVQAFRNLTDDLRSGATVGEAVESFCRFVVYGE